MWLTLVRLRWDETRRQPSAIDVNMANIVFMEQIEFAGPATELRTAHGYAVVVAESIDTIREKMRVRT